MLSLPPSPLIKLNDSVCDRFGVQLFVKRDDMIHPLVQGNKWRKLKYNLLKIKELGIQPILTFGGAFSNHIHATASAGKLFGIETIGIIRGERTTPLSTTLAFAEQCGMSLHFISRSDYKNKENLADDLKKLFGEVYVLPEGGTNNLALKGCREIVEETHQSLGFQPDYFISACGTGGTIAGIIQAASNNQRVLGLSVLKGNFIFDDVSKLLSMNNISTLLSQKHDETTKNIDINDIHQNFCSWAILIDYHFGGYAKWTPELIEFINQFRRQHSIPLDPVYTGKLFFGIYDLIKKGYFPRGSVIVAVHTGGLQGIEGFNANKLNNKMFKIETD